MVKHDAVNKSKKKDKQTNMIIGVIVVAVILAIAGSLFFFSPFQTAESEQKGYNLFNFEQRGKFWITFVELNGVSFEVPFYNHPSEVESIPYDDRVTTLILDDPHSKFWIAVSDNVGATPVLAGANIARVTGKLYGVPTQSALYVEPDMRDENNTVVLQVTCEDATNVQPIIWINPNATTQGVRLDETNPNCVIVGGNGDEEILESADLLAYKILQIM